jgi:hypothetical protein
MSKGPDAVDVLRRFSPYKTSNVQLKALLCHELLLMAYHDPLCRLTPYYIVAAKQGVQVLSDFCHPTELKMALHYADKDGSLPPPVRTKL